MNRPPEEFVRVPADAMRQFACTCLEAAGLKVEHARQLAGLLVNSDLRGVRSQNKHARRLLSGA